MTAWAQFRMDASRHVSRRAGQSAVAAAAYRAGERLWDDRAQEAHDYRSRYGVVASGMTLPERGAPDWSREQLWNAAEAAEARKDARTARKLELALPDAMTGEQREALVRAWASDIAGRYGVAVDWAIHLPDREGDQRNHHAHLMLSTREIGPAGFGAKAALELSNTDQKRRGLPVGDEAIYALRAHLAERLSSEAERHGLDLHADPRSYADRGIDLEPTRHVGVHAVGMDRRGKASDRAALHAETRRDNAAAILARPEIVLETLTQREAVFTRADLARTLHPHLDDPAQFQNALARLEASPELVRLSEDAPGAPARFSTREMVAVETRLMQTAEALSRSSLGRTGWANHARAVDAETVLARPRHERLSAEQRDAVAHVTGASRIAAIAGTAGAGKSAALAAAREAWEEAGLRVRGGALAGKAAEELQRSAGIESRTLHALEYGWRQQRDSLTARDVLVIDEAGMVGSRQLGRVLEAAERAGAKVVLVGDARQLQPIEAGAAFRAVTERIGVAEIDTVRRQREGWQREASQAFARGDTAAGLATYAERGQLRWAESRQAAIGAMVRDAVAGERAGTPSLLLAHTNEDVGTLNARMRAERQAAGLLAGGEAEASFRTERGERRFAAGDRVVFLRNDRDLGVKNGTLGTVREVGPDRLLVALDGDGGGGKHSGAGSRQAETTVLVERSRYDHVEHGYAVTVHKAQGATVERAALLASGGLDRHLAYVGMTRHREGAALYAGRDDFQDARALARRLGRERAKGSTLDYAERRGFETARPWAENARAWIERGRERLEALRDRAEQAVAVVRQRLARQAQIAKEQGQQGGGKAADAREAPDRWSRLRSLFGREREAGVPEPEAAERTAALRARFQETPPAAPAAPATSLTPAEQAERARTLLRQKLGLEAGPAETPGEGRGQAAKGQGATAGAAPASAASETPPTPAQRAEQARAVMRQRLGLDAVPASPAEGRAQQPAKGQDAGTGVTPPAKDTARDYWAGVAQAGSKPEQERTARLRQAMQQPDKPVPTQGQGEGQAKGPSRGRERSR